MEHRGRPPPAWELQEELDRLSEEIRQQRAWEHSHGHQPKGARPRLAVANEAPPRVPQTKRCDAKPHQPAEPRDHKTPPRPKTNDREARAVKAPSPEVRSGLQAAIDRLGEVRPAQAKRPEAPPRAGQTPEPAPTKSSPKPKPKPKPKRDRAVGDEPRARPVSRDWEQAFDEIIATLDAPTETHDSIAERTSFSDRLARWTTRRPARPEQRGCTETKAEVPTPQSPHRPGRRVLDVIQGTAAELRKPFERRLNLASKDDDRVRPVTNINEAVAACRNAFYGIAGISMVTNLLMLTGPLFMLQIYDRVLTSRSVPTLFALLILVACLFFFMGLLELIRSRVMVRVGARVDRMLVERVFQSVISVRPSLGQGSQTQALRDLDQVRTFISGPGPLAMFDMPWAPVYFLVIFLMHWTLGLVAALGAAILFALSIYNELWSRKPLAALAETSSHAHSMAEAGQRNAEAMQAMGLSRTYRDRWMSHHRRGLELQTQASDISGTMTVVTKVTRLFLQSFMLAVGAYLALQQAITPGVIIAASIIMSRALAPVEQSVAQWRGFIAARQGYQRIREALEAMPGDAKRMALPEPKGRIGIERLYASTLGSSEPVLKGLNFQLEPGDALGVIGPSASGKSTLARVLVGVWPTMRGAVRLDGATLDQWDAHELGKHVGYLPQDVELFAGTVEENIARFDPDRDAEAVVRAAKKAGVHELILRLSDGYATKISDGGACLSGGQRQRIALARAIYKDPVFTVLDEPNSNLDAEGEKALTNAIGASRSEGRTVVVMAHRPSAIAAVNRLLLLSAGRQVAFGTKEEVLREHVRIGNGGKDDGNVRVMPAPKRTA